MFLDFLNIDKIRRAVLYAILLAALYLLQNYVLASLRPLGVAAMLLPAAVIAISMFEGGIWGAAFGLLAGLLGDLGYSENLILFTVLFPVLGLASGLMADHVVDKSFFAFLFLNAAALLFIAFCQMLAPWIDGGSFGAVFKIALLQVLWSLPFTLPVYFIGRELAFCDFG